ncbi:unnamed protein product [Nippostrongylus brasiliensis]|uniref:Integrase catalytic domain-containing protein n=1 Tax=Nippostrongylus brasiliensis TaxID=27835 RepID=A0A0N4YTG1_NIPBR|nr:unnamed protein product [Nippostrongylus brasiliensis]
MDTQLRNCKRKLTMFCKKLEKKVLGGQQEEVSQYDAKTAQHELTAVENIMRKVEEVQQDYASMMDRAGDTASTSEQTDYDQYATMVEGVLSTAFDYVTELQCHLQVMTVDRSKPASSPQPQLADGDQLNGTSEAPRVQLPPVPIPVFSGSIWEWQNFWTLFQANVHSQSVPDLIKFNYLINALHGEPRQAIARFQVTEGNYQKAVDFLRTKYSDREALVHQLIAKLESATSPSQSIKDQRQLLDNLQVIMSQLRDIGEQIDSQWLIKQVLTKFPLSIQREILKRKCSKEEPFLMQDLLDVLDKHILCEEKIALFTSNDKSLAQQPKRDERPARGPHLRKSLPCMYCGQPHKSTACTRYTTPQQRAAYLREHKLCLICASPSHTAEECKRRNCFECQGRHHTSCCLKARVASSSQDVAPSKSQRKDKHPSAAAKSKSKDLEHPRPTQQPVKQFVTHCLSDSDRDTEEDAESIAEYHSSRQHLGIGETYLPIGELLVLDPSTRELRRVAALLDSGAECSFIDQQLAEELHLPAADASTLQLRTFGAEHHLKVSTRRVPLDVWDHEGNPYQLQLLTHTTLTSSLKTPSVLSEVVDFIKQKGLNINLVKARKAKPKILIGSDQLWQLMDVKGSPIRLPSGLYLLPTRLGQLLTGQLTVPYQKLKKGSTDHASRESMSALCTTICAMSMDASKQLTPEQAAWEEYWRLQDEGQEEFGQPDKIVQELVDQKVLSDFRSSIQKRPDGYYVCLPWKDIPMALPDNKALAKNRLRSVWSSLQKDKNLLAAYNETFREQLKLGIIEEVDENTPPLRKVHYLPHQAVLTPHKETTKLRVVYDASAHYKGSPSLNDALHRGPVLLPKLFGLLLRFRIGRIALIADVEKAFLQVRLQEEHRDATRCLWLSDYTKSPEPDNIKTYRFTRVTFGLKSSPFLQTATVFHHLDQSQYDRELIKDLKDNLYVDNVIMTSDTSEEALRQYALTKELFNEIHMNLREFQSNSESVMGSIPEADTAKGVNTKVLGIRWEPKQDQLLLVCNIAKRSIVTKRTVASIIASIFDPMGWMLPLTHRARVFLQTLWNDSVDWDEQLTDDVRHEWNTICDDMDGFRKRIPRFLLAKHSRAHLVICADASAEAYAACVYLVASSQPAHLIMAKARLPSRKRIVTIPKLEVSALRLAARLAVSVVNQLKTVTTIDQVLILSDSEIAIGWTVAQDYLDSTPFVRNRVAEIRKVITYLESEHCQVHLGHISTEENVADLATRGIDKSGFHSHPWWNGPAFLSHPKEQWAAAYKSVPIQDTPGEHARSDADLKHVASTEPNVNSVARSTTSYSEIFSDIRASDLGSIRRIVAYALRFIHNSVLRVNRNTSKRIQLSALFDRPLDATRIPNGLEIRRAMKALVKHHQLVTITTATQNALRHLNLYKDPLGLLRCRGRLGRSNLDDDAKFPLLILQKTQLSRLIIEECHGRLHTGISHTMSKVREHYWIPKLKAQVTAIIRRCTQCQRMNNLPFKYPEQGPLPARRVARSHPFQHVGLDYFGPLTVSREGSTDKCYGIIITCLVTRLVHLDLVQDATSAAFLQALRRFFARRGAPDTITSDNAPTFILGEEALAQCFREAQNDPLIANEISARAIHWTYITPFAPWQGGVYERLIKSVKSALYRTLGRITPQKEELHTIIIEIEGMLNTRPLVYVEAEQEEQHVLRPIDLLQHSFKVAPPLSTTQDTNSDFDYEPTSGQPTSLTKKQLIEAVNSSVKIVDKFWQLWQQQYLTALREHHVREAVTSRGSRISPALGQVVLICDACQPRHSWRMGRGEDQGVAPGLGRRDIRRPVNLLVPLELETSETTAPPHHVDQRVAQQQPVEVTQDQQPQCPPRHPTYNLRKKDRVDYARLAGNEHCVTLMLLQVRRDYTKWQQDRLPRWTHLNFLPTWAAKGTTRAQIVQKKVRRAARHLRPQVHPQSQNLFRR